MPRATLRLTLDDASSTVFGPRTGVLTLTRASGSTLTLGTPTLLTPTSRGCVPHLTGSHVRASAAIGLVDVAFESFLEHTPPVPTLHGGAHALHRFLGLEPDKHILAMSARDPADARVMPANGNEHLSVHCLRGVRKLAPHEWTAHVCACAPDVVVALSDAPHTPPPFSQKRLAKSIDRSLAWLAALLASSSAPPVLVPLCGATSPTARAAFAAALLQSPSIPGLPTYDAAIAGYTVDLSSLRAPCPSPSPSATSLLHSSLLPLPPAKPRFVHGTNSPHDILRLIRDVGVDVLDARWAIDAASHGVALDFAFPAPPHKSNTDIGHNLYDTRHRLAFSPLSSSCPCIACSPSPPASRITHGPLEDPAPPTPPGGAHAPYTRAYIHHLLHTHEMSAHALLVSHNLAVAAAFLDGVRAVLRHASSTTPFADHVRRFEDAYRDIGAEEEAEPEGSVVSRARTMWAEVDRARGRGRLRREREAEAEAGMGAGAGAGAEV